MNIGDLVIVDVRTLNNVSTNTNLGVIINLLRFQYEVYWFYGIEYTKYLYPNELTRIG